ncbi:hypothetical protein SLS59_002681 [Nothophoma quercina]|uniref:Uncharacterized protein n=1 Tax=Nothophoma quercina TaxID=749835 RepID=A0ABR3RRC7_9PLEO
MKIEYSLLTLLSASMVAAAPAPFVVTDSAVATGTENAGVPVTGLDRRQQVSVYGFRKRTLELRDALLAARGQRQNQAANDANEDDAEDAEDAQENAQEDAAAEDEQAAGNGKGKGNNEQAAAPLTPPEAPAAPSNTTESAEEAAAQDQAAADQAAQEQAKQEAKQQAKQQEAEAKQAQQEQKVYTPAPFVKLS